MICEANLKRWVEDLALALFAGPVYRSTAGKRRLGHQLETRGSDDPSEGSEAVARSHVRGRSFHLPTGLS
jgi:hypothetical protein